MVWKAQSCRSSRFLIKSLILSITCHTKKKSIASTANSLLELAFSSRLQADQPYEFDQPHSYRSIWKLLSFSFLTSLSLKYSRGTWPFHRSLYPLPASIAENNTIDLAWKDRYSFQVQQRIWLSPRWYNSYFRPKSDAIKRIAVEYGFDLVLILFVRYGKLLHSIILD
jgi:hypothetical protein